MLGTKIVEISQHGRSGRCLWFRDVTIRRKWRIVDSRFILPFQNWIAIHWIDSSYHYHIVHRPNISLQKPLFNPFFLIFCHTFILLGTNFLQYEWIDSPPKMNHRFSIHLKIGILNWFLIYWIVNRDVPTQNFAAQLFIELAPGSHLWIPCWRHPGGGRGVPVHRHRAQDVHEMGGLEGRARRLGGQRVHTHPRANDDRQIPEVRWLFSYLKVSANIQWVTYT